MVHHVAFSLSHQGEVTYTKQLLAHAPNNSLTIFDRCYLSAELLINWQRQHPHAHWMVPIKINTKYTVLHSFSECDHLVEMKVSPQARN
ncbi:hypothetical protein J3U76_12010 [Oceanisphaera sp. DM8]|uniref:Transposase IS4-like domain-containing protein n=1 Tax=Oceanisphaera pacifica TaxID=2818389 RepID=A0ABS3NID9_9GAMM|nr:hypothetical protein [Oceanisphaera pacifica]